MSTELGTTGTNDQELDLAVGEIEMYLPEHADATNTTPQAPITCGGGGYCC